MKALNRAILILCNEEGIVKKTPIRRLFRIFEKVDLIAINFREDDDLIGVKLTDGNQGNYYGNQARMSIRFPELDVRSMGRSATGVRGIHINQEDACHRYGYCSMKINSVLIVTPKVLANEHLWRSIGFNHAVVKGLKP